jgi:GTP-binding protein YchF
MGFSCGIVGLPNSGKSTIFDALTGAGVEIAPFPFTTIEPNIGVVPVPDERLNELARIYSPPKVTPTTIKFVDIAGLVRGASKGEGLGNQFLAHIRDMDANLLVLRCFEEPNVTHVLGRIDPVDDVDILMLELIMKDIETVDARLERAKRSTLSGEKKFKIEVAELENIKNNLLSGKRVIPSEYSEDAKQIINEMRLLTAKPFIYVANVDENQVNGGKYVEALSERAKKDGVGFVSIPGKLELELLQMSEEERRDFMQSFGLKELSVLKLAKEGYRLLNLVTFYTAVGKELRAWSIVNGTTAQSAAGKIHTDMEKGFIKAEVISFNELMQAGSEQKAREMGIVRTEGKEYRIRDGDVIKFLFK